MSLSLVPAIIPSYVLTQAFAWGYSYWPASSLSGHIIPSPWMEEGKEKVHLTMKHAPLPWGFPTLRSKRVYALKFAGGAPKCSV